MSDDLTVDFKIVLIIDLLDPESPTRTTLQNVTFFFELFMINGGKNAIATTEQGTG